MSAVRNPSAKFWHEAGFGLLLSAVAAVVLHGLSPFIGSAALVRWLLIGLGLAYVLRLQRGARAGRIVAPLSWLLLMGGTQLLGLSLWLSLVLGTGALWLIRSLRMHGSVLAAGGDGLVSMLAIAAGVSAAAHSGSVLLAVWSYFLVQAAHVFIRAPSATQPPPVADRFATAQRNAEAALQRLAH